MDAGQLDQKISLFSPSKVSSSSGAESVNWTLHSEPWANVRQVTGREYLSGQVTADGNAVFRIRWRAGVTPEFRVDWRGALYGLNSVTGTQREGWLYLHADTLSEDN